MTRIEEKRFRLKIMFQEFDLRIGKADDLKSSLSGPLGETLRRMI